MRSVSSQVLAVEIITMQMAHTTNITKTEIEFILNIACIGLAPCMSIKMLIHTIQLPSVSCFDIYKGGKKLKKWLTLPSTCNYKKTEYLNLSKLNLLSLLLAHFLNYNLRMQSITLRFILDSGVRGGFWLNIFKPDGDCARRSGGRLC